MLLEEQDKQLTDEQKQELKEKMAELKLTSRFLADSAITTYFGKPAFCAYGNGNVNPAYGGGIYGSYMKTFNVNPHAGGNKPEFSQVHDRALLGGTVQIRAPGSRVAKKKPVKMTRKPIPPRIAPAKKQISKEEHDERLKNRGKIQPETFEHVQARQLQILPPTFNEKNLQTKTVKVEEFTVNVPTKDKKEIVNQDSDRKEDDGQGTL